MPRLKPDQWEEARAMREAGETLTAVAEKFGIDRAAVSRRAKSEGWGDGADIAGAVRRKVTEKVTGLVTACDPKKRAEALDAAAERGVSIITRHQQDWEEHHQRFTVNGVADDFTLGKSAKICAEMLAIRQKAERAAHGLDEAPDGSVVVTWAGQ